MTHMMGLLARGPEPRTPESALRSEVRQRIMVLVEQEPGIPLSRLRQRVGLGWGALYHQVRRLEESGLIQLVQVGRRQLVVSTAARAQDPVLAARARLEGGTAARIAMLVAEGEAHNVTELAQRTGLSARAVRYHVRALIDAGLVTAASSSRHYGLRPTPLLLAALARGATADAPEA